MVTKKPPRLYTRIATKGQNASAEPARSTAPATDAEANNVPLNFRVSADLRRRFRVFAANRDLKLNELLRLAFDEYEKRCGK
jgi:hypothetical protein